MINSEIDEFFKNGVNTEVVQYDDTVEIEKKLIYAMSQVIGTRNEQQDRIAVKEKNKQLLAVVCDGMGGLSGGQIASKYVVEQLIEDFEKDENTNPTDFLLNEAIQLDKEINELKDENGKYIGAGTTLVAVIIKDHKLYYVSVGDSRIYLIRKEEIAQITEDQNYRLTLKRELEIIRSVRKSI